MTRRSPRRALAIDLASRGFGFVVLEGADRIVDWGTRDARVAKRVATLRAVRGLVEFYKPDLLVIEDCRDPKRRRSQRIGELSEDIRALAEAVDLRCAAVSWAKLRRTFGSRDSTKHEIARALAARFPELAFALPPKRKPWQSEDVRGRIFGALAMAVGKCPRGLPPTTTSPSLAASRTPVS